MAKEMRTFKVVKTTRQGKCDTKFKPGRYTKNSQVSAALKAFNQLCRVKKSEVYALLTLPFKKPHADLKENNLHTN